MSCFVCGKPVDAREPAVAVESRTRLVHSACFRCKNCDQPLTAYVLRGAELHCPDCSRPNATTVKCARCALYISGKTVRADGLSWHPHCFVCDRCKARLPQTYVTRDGARLCRACAE